MKRIRFALSVVAAGLMLGGTSARAAGDQSSAGADERQARQIWARLREAPDLQDNRISVDVDDGIATLEGSVDSYEEKKEAQLLAHVEGILGVNNRLVIIRYDR